VDGLNANDEQRSVPTFLRIGAASSWEAADRLETAIRSRIYMAAFGTLSARGAIVAKSDPKLRGIANWAVEWQAPQQQSQRHRPRLRLCAAAVSALAQQRASSAGSHRARRRSSTTTRAPADAASALDTARNEQRASSVADVAQTITNAQALTERLKNRRQRRSTIMAEHQASVACSAHHISRPERCCAPSRKQCAARVAPPGDAPPHVARGIASAEVTGMSRHTRRPSQPATVSSCAPAHDESALVHAPARPSLLMREAALPTLIRRRHSSWCATAGKGTASNDAQSHAACMAPTVPPAPQLVPRTRPPQPASVQSRLPRPAAISASLRETSDQEHSLQQWV